MPFEGLIIKVGQPLGGIEFQWLAGIPEFDAYLATYLLLFLTQLPFSQGR
jgi:hypothetical protein